MILLRRYHVVCYSNLQILHYIAITEHAHGKTKKKKKMIWLRSAWASAQSDESSLSAWRNIGSLATHWAHSEDSDQTAQADRVLRWAHRSFCWFCHAQAHILSSISLDMKVLISIHVWFMLLVTYIHIRPPPPVSCVCVCVCISSSDTGMEKQSKVNLNSGAKN